MPLPPTVARTPAVAQSNPTFDKLRVLAFESRRALDMARLIERFGGVPFVSPSMREMPLDTNRAAIDFANRLITGQRLKSSPIEMQ